MNTPNFPPPPGTSFSARAAELETAGWLAVRKAAIDIYKKPDKTPFMQYHDTLGDRSVIKAKILEYELAQGWLQDDRGATVVPINPTIPPPAMVAMPIEIPTPVAPVQMLPTPVSAPIAKADQAIQVAQEPLPNEPPPMQMVTTKKRATSKLVVGAQAMAPPPPPGMAFVPQPPPGATVLVAPPAPPVPLPVAVTATAEVNTALKSEEVAALIKSQEKIAAALNLVAASQSKLAERLTEVEKLLNDKLPLLEIAIFHLYVKANDAVNAEMFKVLGKDASDPKKFMERLRRYIPQ